jgi:hypothetical protein
MGGAEWYRGPCRVLPKSTVIPDGDPVVTTTPLPAPLPNGKKYPETYNLLDLRGQKPYLDLIGLSEECSPVDATGIDELFYSCLTPPASAQRKVQAFIEKQGMLTETENYVHACYRPELMHCILAVQQEPPERKFASAFEQEIADVMRATLITSPAEPVALEGRLENRLERLAESLPYSNKVSWVLWEALVLRSAYNIWLAIQDYQNGVKDGSRKLKKALDTWAHPTGFDEEAQQPHRWRPKTNQRNEWLAWRALFYFQADLLEPHLRLATIEPRFRFPEKDTPGYDKTRLAMPGFVFLPSSYLNACWLQFYADIQSGETAGRICRGCGIRFFPARRADQAYHNEACGNKYRAKESRLQKKLATPENH